MFENYPSLLVTKLYIPRLRSSNVSRAHLLAALDAAAERKLILIAAAAGFGKTSLVAEWCSQRENDSAWFSMDAGDNDPARFLSYLIAAIQMRRAEIGQELLAMLQAPQPPLVENILQVLINQLAAQPTHLTLVLDDYHVIDNQRVHEALSFLVEHLPPYITIVLLTRTDPPLLLARLRARNELLELRAAELRFSLDEAERFLNKTMQLALSRDAVMALDTHTEGWIAGLQLATIAMQSSSGDKQKFVESFTGSHRFILDYLIEEVLSRQSEPVRRFLLQTSILRRLNGSLCSAVTGEADGQAMLEYLERNNLFLVPLDQSRGWYRYHHLFADLLQARLQVEDPEIVKSLRKRAAGWHAENGFPEEAVEHALAAKDFEGAAELITGPALNVIKRGEIVTLLDWYKAFPPGFVYDYPRLGLQVSLALALNGQWNEVDSLLSHAPTQYTEDLASLSPETLAMTYIGARHRHDAARLAALATQAAANPHLDTVTKLVLGLLVSIDGDLRHACQIMADVQQTCEREGDIALAMTTLFHRCRFEVFLGNLHHAHALSLQALQRSHDLGRAALPMATFAHVTLGRVFIEWNKTDDAQRHLTEAIRLAELTGFITGTVSSATMMIAEVKQGQGDSEGAIQTAQNAISIAERNDPAPEVFWLKYYQMRIWLTQGDASAAANLLNTMQDFPNHPLPASIFYPYTIQKVAQARLFLAQRKPEKTISMLKELMAGPRDLLTVEVAALLALARQAHGDGVNAILTLEQALTLAEAENRIRAFLDLGAPMAKLLGRFCETHPDHAYAKKLLSAFPSPTDSASSVEFLSERELEVLRLIAAGHSNDEIAQALTIAISTVKWYVNTLYSKLHVKTRSQAIARAHELKLLAD